MARTTFQDWRSVVGYEGLYEVSDTGDIYSIARRGTPGGLLRLHDGPYAYLITYLYQGGKSTTKNVHVLVATAFLGPRPDGLEVRHLNGDAHDNSLINLTYGTSAQNKDDQRRHGTHHNKVKDCCKDGHSFDEANTIRENGKRACRICRNLRRQERRRL